MREVAWLSLPAPGFFLGNEGELGAGFCRLSLRGAAWIEGEAPAKTLALA
jgi:hypothetical protein